ncbi:MAG: hypothetical protein CVU22_07580 [Betaproteobacteria bacterium HGW-Betaproteobacteria-16]|nr:MAG: hypothetical protein CVU22_07580 [Betaproteobacteria bacterium HGW-Betaproteobacteria-16]
MPASVTLLRHWRSASLTGLTTALHHGQASVEAFANATEASGSLLQSWVQGAEVVEYEHYPPADVIDLESGTQFYYHAHRTHGDEHGHVHVFWHATPTGRRSRPNKGRKVWKRHAPTHMLAIALDARGLPVKLFTTNLWVTEGHWFDAAVTLACLDRCRLGPVPGHENSCAWLSHFLAMYRPLIADLLHRRDARLASCGALAEALNNRHREVLSQSRVDWAADLDALQAETIRRGI